MNAKNAVLEKQIKAGVDVDAVGLKASKETQDDRKFSHMRQKLVEDMEDEAEELRELDADEATWGQFKAKYAQKWEEYRNTSAQTFNQYEEKRLEAEKKAEEEE